MINAIGEIHSQLHFNPNVNLGYYDQELKQFQSDRGRMDWLHDRAEVPDDRIKQVLLQNGIPFPDFNRQVNRLSGGECARLMFMLFQLNKPNFLVLDEPTNHIDIQGREQLEQQLIESEATLLITSHDRRFIERVANRWWWINNQQLTELNGLEEFYEVVKHDATPENASGNSPEKTQSAVESNALSVDEKLARLEELETLLREDKARKAKFQKPERQQQWENEIANLWKDLE